MNKALPAPMDTAWNKMKTRQNNSARGHYIEDHYMSVHVLLNLVNELGKRDKMLVCGAFYLFFATSLINSIIQEQEC